MRGDGNASRGGEAEGASSASPFAVPCRSRDEAMKADLHIHSTASDGAWAPDRVVRAAAAGGLDVIALADHDTTAGVAPAIEAARGTGAEVIPAVELSTTRDGRELHLLGYFVDPAAAPMRAHEEKASVARLERMEVMVARLREGGVDVAMDAVLRAAGSDAAVLARPHLAQALVLSGHADSIADAFDRFIGDRLPAFQPTALLDPADGIEIVLASGGVPVWAHPPGDLLDPLLPELVRAGLRGLEAYRPLSGADQVRRIERIARSAGLLVTGGSDWHSPDRNPPLGDFHVPSGTLDPLMEEGRR